MPTRAVGRPRPRGRKRAVRTPPCVIPKDCRIYPTPPTRDRRMTSSWPPWTRRTTDAGDDGLHGGATRADGRVATGPGWTTDPVVRGQGPRNGTVRLPGDGLPQGGVRG